MNDSWLGTRQILGLPRIDRKNLATETTVPVPLEKIGNLMNSALLSFQDNIKLFLKNLIQK